MIKLFRRGLKMGAAESRQSYEQAVDLLFKGERDAALERLKQAVRQDSANVFAYLRLGDLLRENGDADRAINIHRDLRLRSDLGKELDLRIMVSLARDYISAGKFASAVSTIRGSRIDLRGDREVLEVFIVALEGEGQWKEALDRRMDLLKLEGGKPDKSTRALYLSHIGWSYFSENKLDLARVRLEEAVKLDGNSPAALYYMGCLKGALGDPEEAVKFWDRFLQRHPDNAYLVYPKLEAVLFELGKFNEFIERLSRVMDAVPGQPQTALALARLQEQMGEDERARKTLEEALINQPGDRSLRTELAGILYRGDDFKGAAELLVNREEVKEDEGFTCRKCGHPSNDPLWYCPSCRAFGSFME